MNFPFSIAVLVVLELNFLFFEIETSSLSECESLQPNKIRILEEEKDLRVWFGSEVSITCCMKLNGNGEEDNNYPLMWYDPNMKPIQNYFSNPEKAQNDGVFLIPDMLQKTKDLQVVHMVIKNFSSSDNGKYKCDTSGGYHSPVEINIVGNPKIVIDADEYQFIEEGETGYIKCHPRGHPKIDVVWFYEGEHLSTDNHNFSFLQNHQVLRISKVTESFRGKYVCKAEVTFSDPMETPPKGNFVEIQPIDVIVYQSPILTNNSPLVKNNLKSLRDNDVAVIENGVLEIECDSKGLPPPKIRWYMNDKLLNSSTDPRVDITESYYRRNAYSVLKIEPVQIQDIGTYTCNSSFSSHGFSRSVAQNVTPEFLFQPRFLKLGTSLNASSLPGKDVILNCTVFGAFSNRLSVSFIQDDYNSKTEVYDKTTNNPSYQYQMKQDPFNPYVSQYQLTITDINPSNSGWYYCQASLESEDVYSVSSVGIVSVLYGPNIYPINKTIYGLWYKRNILKCKARGFPNPSWEWKFQGLELPKLNKRYDVKVINFNDTSISELIISPNYLNDDIFGTYECIATNQFGLDSKSVLFSQASQPGAPIVNVCKVTASTIQLCILPNTNTGGLPLTHYEMRIKDDQANKYFGPYYYPVNPSTITLSHLKSDMRYKIALSSASEAGRGPNTNIEVTTKSLSPPIIELVNTSAAPDWNAFNLQWVVDTDGGSPIVKYSVKIQQVEVDPETKQVVNRIGKSKSYVIDDFSQIKHMFRVNSLHPNTWYELKFVAQNVLGPSVIQEVVFRTLEMPLSLARSARLRDPFGSANHLKLTLLSPVMALPFLFILFFK